MQTKFIILTTSRTGSTWLTSLLSSHPSICCQGEIAKYPKFLSNVPQNLNLAFSKSKPICGFKIFYYHGNDQLWNILISDMNIHVIHLRRKNYLDMVVSKKMMQHTGTGNISNKKKVITNFRTVIDPKECEQFFTDFETSYTKFSSLFKNHPMLEIVYEDLVQNPYMQCNSILNFLGAKKIKLHSDIVKRNHTPIHEAISNYNELKLYFSNTKWASMFI